MLSKIVCFCVTLVALHLIVATLGASEVQRSVALSQKAESLVQHREPGPEPPAEIRRLLRTPMPEAADILSALSTKRGASQDRLHLAELYKKAGYDEAARFFENSARVAQGQKLDQSPVKTAIAWVLARGDVTGSNMEVTREIGELDLQGKYEEAVDLAERELARNGPSQQVVVQWASAVVWKLVAKPSSVSSTNREEAMRILLTSFGEHVTRPIDALPRAQGYARLSSVFLALGDDISALTAAITGVYSIHNGPYWLDSGPEVRKRLCDRVQALKKKLGFGTDVWVSGDDSRCEP